MEIPHQLPHHHLLWHYWQQSLFDIVLAVFSSRFYSNAAFITVFGVAGVFAACISYINCIAMAPKKNEFARWSLISTLIACGLLIFFFVARIEGGEYEIAFKAFGVTLALASLLFAKGKVDV